jgi:anti-sigma B factor antagonist
LTSLPFAKSQILRTYESMSMSPTRMWVLTGERFACVKINGRANFSSSIDFKTLVSELLHQGYTYFVLDLSECLLMDSTFLGVLAGFGLKLGPGRSAPSEAAIELLNPSARITELLENLGVLHLFKLTQGQAAAPDGTEACPCTPANPSKEEIRSACLEAHQTLMAISPGNISKFKDLAAFLAEDLKKPKPGG